MEELAKKTTIEKPRQRMTLMGTRERKQSSLLERRISSKVVPSSGTFRS